MVNTLRETLEKTNGIGLAAPQTGIFKNVFAINTSPLIKENPDIEIVQKSYINPTVMEVNENTSFYKECCLSIPGIFEDVERPDKIWLRYYDENFIVKEEELNGITAGIFQHECDHLHGILFIDLLSKIRKKLINNKLKRLKILILINRYSYFIKRIIVIKGLIVITNFVTIQFTRVKFLSQ